MHLVCDVVCLWPLIDTHCNSLYIVFVCVCSGRAHVLILLQMGDLRNLCGQCGVDPRGSRMDIVSRLRKEMQNRDAYDKVFSQIWGASGNQPSHETKCCRNLG